jgi:hypothetical protein
MDAGRDGDRLGDGWLARGRRRPEAEAASCGGGGGCVGGTLLFCFYHGGEDDELRGEGRGFRVLVLGSITSSRRSGIAGLRPS